MEYLSMCRICLATDVRLCSVLSHLRDMYERITDVTFKKEDRRPLVACYICHARLQGCYRLRTNCLRSEKLLTKMMSSGVLKPQDMLSTNTFRVVSALQLSLGHAMQDGIGCHVKEAASEDFSDTELDQLYTKDIVTKAQDEPYGLKDDNNQCSHLGDSLDVIKEEADDAETDAEYINLEDGNIKLEEIGWEPDIAGASSQTANNLCPKIEKVASERTGLNDSRIEDHKRQATEKISIEVTSSKLTSNKEAEAGFAEAGSVGNNIVTDTPVVMSARVSKKPEIAAVKDAEDVTTNRRKIEVIANEETESVTIIEPKIITKKIVVKKPVTTSKILETWVKVDKCDYNALPSEVNNVCEQKSTNDTSLEQNVKSISCLNNKPFSCDTCNKCFSYKNVLKNHILTHTGEKPYECNVCRKCFIQKGHLQIHIRTHTGDKPYQCKVCKKCFNSKGTLKKHVVTHTGEKPYQCNICKKSFIQKWYLNNHILKHIGDKPHQCNICKKCFNRKDVLQKHIRTHTGERPYQCNVCKKGFNQKANLKTHTRTHTESKNLVIFQ